VKRHDRRRASAEARAELRSQVLALRAEGKTFVEISAVTGYARTYCVTLAGKLEKRPDLAAVVNRGGRPTGNGRHLTSRQEAQALRWICGRYPDQLRLPFALWTRRAVQELFRTKFDVSMPIRTVGLYLERWGLTPQRPSRRAYERDDAAVDRWLRVEYPKIARMAKENRAEICWGDETGVRSDESRHRGYALRGKTPILRIPVRRSSVSVISALTNQGTVRFMIYKGALSPDILLRFLRRLIQGRKRPIFLILDNLRVHKARKVAAWVERNASRIRIFFLPPYSPELNPDEYLNGDFKRGVYTGVPPRDAADLRRRAFSQLRSIQRSPNRVRAYFQHPAIQYAA
jgi:transposase